jgi:hypothetical protein
MNRKPKDNIIARKQKPVDITFHYTDPELAKKCISICPVKPGDITLDPCCGGGSFSKNLKNCLAFDEDVDFLKYEGSCDWIITNPPFHIGWKFLDKATDVARKGVGFLFSTSAWNQLTPRRLAILQDKNFGITKIMVCQDKRWFGRYYFTVFEKNKPSIIYFDAKLYGKEM